MRTDDRELSKQSLFSGEVNIGKILITLLTLTLEPGIVWQQTMAGGLLHHIEKGPVMPELVLAEKMTGDLEIIVELLKEFTVMITQM